MCILLMVLDLCAQTWILKFIATKQCLKIIFWNKKPSWLATICNYDLLCRNVIDYMHCVLLGVTKNVIEALV